MSKYRGKFSGWGQRGRPFSKKEFAKSHIKGSQKGSYGSYLSSYARFYKMGGNYRKSL